MSEPNSLYVQVHISPAAYQRFLSSPIATTLDFDDWMEWIGSAEMYGGPMSQSDIDEIGHQTNKDQTVEDSLSGWQEDDWSCALSHYDPEQQIWQLGVLQFSENYQEYLYSLPFVRAVHRFKDLPGDDFLLLYPFIWSNTIEIAYTLDQQESRMLREIPADWKEKADAFLSSAMPEDFD